MSQAQRKELTTFQGEVASKSGNMTVKVILTRLQKHPKYGKILRRRTVAHVHDPNNQAQPGDTVEITKCRPISKTKTWRLVRIVENPAVAGK